MIHHLVEVAEKHPPAADGSFGELFHAVQFLGVERLLTAFVDEALAGNYVGVGIEHHRLGLDAVAARTPDLLIVALDVAGHVVVDDPADVALVDTHSEGHGGADNLDIAVDEQILRAVAFRNG